MDHSSAQPASRLFPCLCGGHRQLTLENLALRHQVAVYKRTVGQPRLRTADRLVWVGLTRVWPRWRQSLVFVTPDMVVRWQRRSFRKHWVKLSGRLTVGRRGRVGTAKALGLRISPTLLVRADQLIE